MKAENGMCPICGSKALKKETITETFRYKGKEFDYPNYIVYRCEDCSETIVDKNSIKESARAIRDFYRKVDGLLVSSEIRRIRKFRLCLTQDEASKLLGGGAKSFARYENNEVIQSEALDNLLRILDEAPHLLEIIRNKHNPKSKSEIIRIDSKYGNDEHKMVANYG